MCEHHLPAALGKNLLCCYVVVSKWVSRITILVQDDRVGDLRKQALGHRDVGLWRIPGRLCWCPYDLGSKSAQGCHLRIKFD